LDFKDFELENDNEETEEAEEKESRDLSRWEVTIPHMVMETKQVIVHFAQVVYSQFFSCKCLNKKFVASCCTLGAKTHRYFSMRIFFLREGNVSCIVWFIPSTSPDALLGK